MEKPSIFHTKNKAERNKIAFQGGTYSLLITTIVLSILVVVNIFASALPSSVTKYDISSTQLYSITSNTKVVVNALDQDVTIYWVVQADKEDSVIENLLEKYEGLSNHIDVVKKNPDAFPTFTEQYTSETVQNNSLIVECGDRNRYIAYDDIYVTESDMYSYSATTSFDGEGAITSAIDYVTSDILPVMYVLEGHGEAELPSNLSGQIEKENIEVTSLSLLTVDEIPEDADMLMIYAPSSDISEAEKDMLSDYVGSGGKLFVAAGPLEEGSLDNLNALIEDYSVEVAEGIVIESDREHYASMYQYMLLPEFGSSELTYALMEENYYIIMPLANGLTITGENSRGTVTQLLTTSEKAYSKTEGYALESYEKEDGDLDGPFALGVSIEDNSGGQIVWFSSSAFLDDMYNAYSSGANGDLAMNAISSLVGETEAMAIRSKSLNYNYLTISDSTSSMLKILMIGILPLAYLGIGIAVIMRRRMLQNGTV